MLGVGIDIVTIEKMELNDSFIAKILSCNEILILNNKKNSQAKKAFLAGRWAVKEAIFKASNQKINFNQIDIGYDISNKPCWLNNSARWFLSISHNEDTAIAIAYLFEE